MRRLLHLLHLSSAGGLMLLDEARPAALRPLTRALIELDGDARVCLDVGPLATLPENSLVLLRLRLDDARWLNLNRPLFARQRLRVVLWSEPGVAEKLHELAPDFFDWISHVVVCPELVPEFVAAGLRAAPAFPGVVWRGPLDPETALSAVFPHMACQRRAWSRRYEDIVAAIRDAAPGWLVWDGLRNVRACQRLRFAMREVGRDDLRCMLVDPPMRAPGFWPIDTSQADWDAAAQLLAAHAPELDAARLAALSGLEPSAQGLLTTRDPRHLEELLLRVDDPGAELAPGPEHAAPLAEIATRRAPAHVLRRWASEPRLVEFVRTTATRVEQRLITWFEDTKEAIVPPNHRWSATADDLLIWSAAAHRPRAPLAAAAIPIPEGALALEALLSPESAPRDDEDLDRLVQHLYRYGHFDAALRWSTRGNVSESLRADLRLMTDPAADPTSPDGPPPMEIHFNVVLGRIHTISIEPTAPAPATDSDDDPERRLEGIWHEQLGALAEPQLLFATFCQQLAERLTTQGRHAEALRLLERALANYRPLVGPEHYSVGHAYAQMSTPLFVLGRTEEGVRRARRALVILRDTVGDGHPVTLGVTRQLGAHLLLHNEVEEAWTLTRSVLQGALREAPSTLATADTLLFMGTIELARGRAKIGQQHFDQALTIALTHGVTSEPVAKCHQSIALALWSRGKLAQALDHMRKARAIMEHLHGPGSAQARGLHATLAMFLARTGQLSEAEALLRMALQYLAPEDTARFPLTSNLAALLLDTGRASEAEELLDEALSLARTRTPDPAALGQLTVNLATLYMRTGRDGQGIALLQRYIDDPSSAPDHAAVAAIHLARILAASGQHARALALAARALERGQSALVAAQDIPQLRDEMTAWATASGHG